MQINTSSQSTMPTGNDAKRTHLSTEADDLELVVGTDGVDDGFAHLAGSSCYCDDSGHIVCSNLLICW
jgi:hypothetical protein